MWAAWGRDLAHSIPSMEILQGLGIFSRFHNNLEILKRQSHFAPASTFSLTHTHTPLETITQHIACSVFIRDPGSLRSCLRCTCTTHHMTDCNSHQSSWRMRTPRCLAVVNRRQKGVFASSQNKTKQERYTRNSCLSISINYRREAISQ